MSTHMQHYQAAQDISAAQEHRRTLGEKMFDWGVYGGVGYAVTFLASIALAHVAKNYSGNALNRSYTKIRDSISKHTNSEGFGNFGASVFFLGIPGWVLLAPIKWIEDSKGQISRSLDKTFGTFPQSEKEQQEYMQYFDQQPKQSYGSLFGGRVIAYPPIVAISYFLMERGGFKPYLSRKMLNNLGPLFNWNSKPKNLADLAADDAILTAVATGITYAGSKTIAHYFHKDKKDIHLEQPEQSPNPFIQQKQYEGTQQPAEELQAKIA